MIARGSCKKVVGGYFFSADRMIYGEGSMIMSFFVITGISEGMGTYVEENG